MFILIENALGYFGLIVNIDYYCYQNRLSLNPACLALNLMYSLNNLFIPANCA